MIGRSSLVLSVASFLASGAALAEDGTAMKPEIVVYQVGQKVSAFESQDDFSSPEAAYATINRRIATGTGDWKVLSCTSVNNFLGPGPFKIAEPSADESRLFRSAEILTVRIYRGSYAHVVARFAEGPSPIDTRSFEWEGGRWLNAGNSRYATVDEAANEFEPLVRRRQDLERIQSRNPVEAPETMLASCAAFFRANGQPPKEYVLNAIEQHALVAIGEIHHRPLYWRLNSDIVQDPRFAKAAGTVYLELPMHAQPLIDEFLAAGHLDKMLVGKMLRDNLWTGWPDEAMLDFFVTIWQVNQKLDETQRIRIVLVDMKRPWSELIREEKLDKYNCDRDKLMADNIRNDMLSSPDHRHALFIVGFAHLENIRLAGAERPRINAGHHLRNWLGKDLFSIVQHGPVIANMGRVSGRTCMGLFDEAFTANGKSPIAFSLRDGPFGTQRYDLNGDYCDSSMSLYSEAFDGYVYLGPLEQETFSPLIPEFYTDDFVKELDQRHRLVFGSGLKEGLGLRDYDARSFADWMARTWGQPREWRYSLGPVTKWRQGNKGDEYIFWCDPPAPPAIDANPATKDGMVRLVDDIFQHNFRDITDRKTIDWSPVSTDAKGNSSIIYKFEATIQGVEKKVMTVEFTFAPNGGLISLVNKSESP